MGLIPYIGGDTWIAHKIVRLLPKGRTFLEAFGGGGAVTLKVAELGRYEEVIYNEKDFYVYACFWLVKNKPSLLATVQEILDDLANALLEGRREYVKEVLRDFKYEFRNEEVKDIEEAGIKALVLYYFSHVSYTSGTLLRWTDNPRRFHYIIQKLMRYHKILTKVKIMNKDALELIPKYDKEGVVMYLDPPHLTRFGRYYYRVRFSKADAIRLNEVLSKIRRAKVLIKLSEEDLPYYPSVTEKWYRTYIKAPKFTKPGVSTQNKTTYVLYTNYRVEEVVYRGLVHYHT